MNTGKADPLGTDPLGASADPMDRAVFTATIRPNRSLGRDGFRIMMVLCATIAFATSLRFVLMGFWPVSGFMALDLVGLFVAFRISYRRGRAFEELVLTPLELLVRKVTHRGDASERRLNPLWTKIVRDTHEEWGLQRLILVSRGEQIVIARELSPGEREHLADELGLALAQVKRGY